ncbi:MAG: lysylphosphatidylglycerol synthase transmembrane domain-containing protein [Caldilineaceae bacterium]
MVVLVYVLRRADVCRDSAGARRHQSGRCAAAVAGQPGGARHLLRRWWLFLHARRATASYHKLVGYRLAARLASATLRPPNSHFGGEPLQVYLVTQRHGVPASASIAAVTLDKIFELIVNFTFLAAGLLFVIRTQVSPADVGNDAVFYALGLLALPLVLLALLWRGRHPLSGALGALRRVTDGPRLQRWQAVLRTSEDDVAVLCRTQPSILTAALGVSLLSWAAIIGEYWLMTRLLGLPLTLEQALLALVAARIAILLPMPAGLGALEASQVLALQMLGFSGATGATIALIIRARDVFLGLIGLWIGGAGIWTVTVTASQEEAALVPVPVSEPVPVSDSIPNPSTITPSSYTSSS